MYSRADNCLENMAEELIDLTPEETEIFIDLWEAHEALWNVSHKQYRSRSARRAACSAISEAMALNWTVGQVKRKIDNLSTYYGKTKWKVASGKTSESSQNPRWKRTRVWVHYDRIRRFLSRNDDNPQAQIALSNMQVGGTGSRSDDGNSCAGSSDNETNYKVQFAQSQETTSRVLQPIDSPQSHQTSHYLPAVLKTRTLPTLPLVPANQNRPVTEHTHPTPNDANDLSHMAAKLTKSAMEQPPWKTGSMEQSRNGTYGQYVSERLDMITNQRRLLDVRHKIDCLLHEALMT